jgi:hypothetical protein
LFDSDNNADKEDEEEENDYGKEENNVSSW